MQTPSQHRFQPQILPQAMCPCLCSQIHPPLRLDTRLRLLQPPVKGLHVWEPSPRTLSGLKWCPETHGRASVDPGFPWTFSDYDARELCLFCLYNHSVISFYFTEFEIRQDSDVRRDRVTSRACQILACSIPFTLHFTNRSREATLAGLAASALIGPSIREVPACSSGYSIVVS